MAKKIFVNAVQRSRPLHRLLSGDRRREEPAILRRYRVLHGHFRHHLRELLTHDKYRQFTSKRIADAKTSSQVLICLSADSRDAVDDMVGKAQGGAVVPIRVRSRTMASCMAAALKILTATTGK